MNAPQTLQTKRKYYLDIARVIAIISISLNHAVNRSYANYAGQMKEFYSIPLWSTIFKTVISVFSRIGVPLFLMITGILLLNKIIESPRDIKKFYKHNLWGVFITTEVWLVLIYFFMEFLGDSSILRSQGVWASIDGLLRTMLFVDQRTFGSLWYMPMILCIYTTLPFVVVVKDKLSEGKFSCAVLLPVILVYIVTMVFPAINALLMLNGKPTWSADLKESNLFSMYYLYILTGYFVGQGGLSRWKGWLVGLLTALSFGLCCGMQFYAYSRPAQYLVAYSFPLMPVCAGLLLELLRRGAEKLRRVERPVTYLSRIAFGIYFMHMMVMTVVNSDYVDRWLHYGAWEPALKTLFLEVVSVGVSIPLIAVLSKIKVLRKYLFMVK